MNEDNADHDQVFILRFWRKTIAGERDQKWRAQLRYINAQERQLTDDVEGAFSVVRSRLQGANAAQTNQYPTSFIIDCWITVAMSKSDHIPQTRTAT
jgi:hypothetical protein